MSKPSAQPKAKPMPRSEYSQQVLDSGVKTFTKRILIGTASTGNIRMEWAAARYGMVIPANFSSVVQTQYVSGFIPLRYSIADAQNLIVQRAVEDNYNYLLLIEHDTCPPADALIKFNQHIRDDKYPVVSGLYFTRSDPAEPMIYRGRGNSYYTDWKLGDIVMADGVPTGMLLINMKLMRLIYNDCEEYLAGGMKVRRVFDTPVKTWFNEATGAQEALVGTSDLDWCERIIKGNYLEKAGYKELAKEQYPFAVDSSLHCLQIDPDGTQFPIGGVEQWCAKNGNL